MQKWAYFIMILQEHQNEFSNQSENWTEWSQIIFILLLHLCTWLLFECIRGFETLLE